MLRRLMPSTLEQSTGLFMVIMAAGLAWKPFASALDFFRVSYGIVLSVQVFGAWLLFSGVGFIALKRVGRRTFAVLFLPCDVYAGCLTWTFLNSSAVGILGSGAWVFLCILVPWLYGKRATRRERGIA